MILKFVNVDKRFVRTFERSNTFANAYERSQKINVNVQNSIYYQNKEKKIIFDFDTVLLTKFELMRKLRFQLR